MNNEEGKYVIFDSCGKPLDAEFIKGSLDACGIESRIIGDRIGTELGTSFVKVVVLYNDLDKAIREVYSPDIVYDDYKDFLTPEEFKVKQQCNKIFCQLALKLHPGFYDGKDERKNKLYEKIKVKYYDSDLKFLAEMNNLLSEELGLPTAEVPTTSDDDTSDEEVVVSPSDSINGWLSVYVIMLLLSGIYHLSGVVFLLFTSQKLDSTLIGPAELFHFGVKISPFAIMLMGLCYSALFFYAAFAMIKRHSYAIFWNKAIMFCKLYLSIHTLIILFIASSSPSIIIFQIISICLSIIWLFYLKSSKQVNRLFPKDYQKVTQEDWLLFFLMFIAFTGVAGTIIAIFILSPNSRRYRRHYGNESEKS